MPLNILNYLTLMSTKDMIYITNIPYLCLITLFINNIRNKILDKNL